MGNSLTWPSVIHRTMEWQWPLDVVAAEKYEEGGSFEFHQWTELCKWTRDGELREGLDLGAQQ